LIIGWNSVLPCPCSFHEIIQNHGTFVFFTLKKYKNHCTLLLIFPATPTPLDCCRADLFLQGKKTPLSKKLQIEGEDEGRGIYTVGYSVQNCGFAQYGRKCGLTKGVGGEKIWAYREIGGEKMWAY
jgi:hypothetical protein